MGVKRITCYRCDLASFYKCTVQQVRRNPELLAGGGEEIRADHVEMWKTVPRFAEIPETIKCKRCKEVLGSIPSVSTDGATVTSTSTAISEWIYSGRSDRDLMSMEPDRSWNS